MSRRRLNGFTVPEDLRAQIEFHAFLSAFQKRRQRGLHLQERRRTEPATITGSASAATPPTVKRVMPSLDLGLQIQIGVLFFFLRALLQPSLHLSVVAPYSLLDQLVRPRRSHRDRRLGASERPEVIIPSPRYIEAVAIDTLTSASITGEIYNV